MSQARQGEDEDGPWAERATSLNSTPPGDRKAPAREKMEFLKAKGQVGYQPSITTDAQLGNSEMANQSAEILLGFRKGDGSTLVRREGSCARAHQGAENAAAQRAKEGCRPCCTKATHLLYRRGALWECSRLRNPMG